MDFRLKAEATEVEGENTTRRRAAGPPPRSELPLFRLTAEATRDFVAS
jgi:hypothetical protein